eukprot:Awhi_evm2s1186
MIEYDLSIDSMEGICIEVINGFKNESTSNNNVGLTNDRDPNELVLISQTISGSPFIPRFLAHYRLGNAELQ